MKWKGRNKNQTDYNIIYFKKTIMKEIKSSLFNWYIIKWVLVLKFNTNKATYIYPNIWSDKLDALVKAESKWKYFLAEIQKQEKDFKKL